MKPTSKKDYPFVVECENIKQTNHVLNHYDNNNDQWAHWKYVVIKSDSDNDIYENIKNWVQEYGELNIIPYYEWLQLPDYAQEEVAFKSLYKVGEELNDGTEKSIEFGPIKPRDKKIIGYKLVKPEYEEVAGRIAYKFLPTGNYKLIKVAEGDVNILVNSTGAERLKKAGVLDLWFEPVYEQDPYQELFNYMSEQHNLTLLESEMQDIINIVNKIQK